MKRHYIHSLLLATVLLAPPLCAASPSPIQYLLDLRDPASHLVKVTMTVPNAAPGTEIQFPAWNNLYQIRDFVKNVRDLAARCDGQPARLEGIDFETWRSPRAGCRTLAVHYEVFADRKNVFSSALTARYALLNFAQLLFYLPQERERPVRVSFQLPAEWNMVTLFEHGARDGVYSARNYDLLADCPVLAGSFEEYQYRQGGADYRVVVDARRKQYSKRRLLSMVERITTAETRLMRNVPFSRYTFIYQFPPSGGGGMEHRYGAVIGFPAPMVHDDPLALESITAHEFFHLWNVKRIRPQGLEPIDYVHGNDTSDLWFSEGVTNTYASLTVLRAGFESRREFLRHIANAITQLESRPARHFQSVEDSGRSAWLEGYPEYLSPDRSISYYNKGELLGYLLDLAIREGSGNRSSLDGLMRALDRNFAERGKFFTDADLIALIRRLAPGFKNVNQFFSDDVDGATALDYNRYFGYAGLRVTSVTVEEPSLSFAPVRGFGGPVVAEAIAPGGPAERAGLKAGDALLSMNGAPVTYPPNPAQPGMKAGEEVRFRVERAGKQLEIIFPLASEPVRVISIEKIPGATPAERRIRNGWFSGWTTPARSTQTP